MQVRNTTQRWGAVSKLLHWSVVVLVIAQFVLANLAADLPLGMAKLAMLARHKSVGITILALAVLRLLWRSSQPAPALPAGMPMLQRRLAQGTHGLLYALLFAMPLSGWMMSSAKNYPVSWFGLYQLPDLVAPGESTYRALHAAHETMAALLALTALLHLLGALKHHFVDRDDVLRRMLPFVRTLAPLAGVTALLIVAGAAAATTRAANGAPATTVTPVTPVAPATPATTRYALDPARSTLEFRFVQAGATAKGRFGRFQVQFEWPAVTATATAASGPVAGAVLAVDIDVASLDTADVDRDATLRGDELFATARFPRATFRATQIVRLPASGGRAAAAGADATYEVRGSLQIRDQTRAARFPVALRLVAEGGRRVALLRGETTLRRLDHGVGQGEWQSTEWVGNDVVVRWDLRLQESP